MLFIGSCYELPETEWDLGRERNEETLAQNKAYLR